MPATLIRSARDAEALVTSIYQALLGRAPDPGGRAVYVESLVTGRLSPADMVGAIQTSDEAVARAEAATAGILPVTMNDATYQVSGNMADPYFQEVGDAGRGFETMRSVLSRFCPQDCHVIDVGANIGLSTLFASSLLPKAQVLALEPSPTNFAYLEQNVVRNGLGNVRIRNVAASDQVGVLELHEQANFGAGNYVVKENRIGSIGLSLVKVEAKPLDLILEEEKVERVDFIKIDVEGSELDVLNGMQETLRRFRPIVFMEINTWALIAWRNMTPRTLLDRFLALCPCAFSFDGQALMSLAGDGERTHFLHRHLFQNECVEDIVGSPDPARLLVANVPG